MALRGSISSDPAPQLKGPPLAFRCSIGRKRTGATEVGDVEGHTYRRLGPEEPQRGKRACNKTRTSQREERRDAGSPGDSSVLSAAKAILEPITNGSPDRQRDRRTARSNVDRPARMRWSAIGRPPD